MDVFLRTIAIIIEVGILGVIAYSLLGGARLAVFDLGLKPRYGRTIAMVLLLMGGILGVFFIAHLTVWYPTIG